MHRTTVALRQPLTTVQSLLEPLCEADFASLYDVARDPLIWEQHPEKTRWQRDVFTRFFRDALANDLGCFVIRERRSLAVLGSTRFYGLNTDAQVLRIGFTFLGRAHWATGLNREIKDAMLARAFDHSQSVWFDIGPENHRSIAAVKKLGARYSHTEGPTKAVYQLKQSDWVKNHEQRL